MERRDAIDGVYVTQKKLWEGFDYFRLEDRKTGKTLVWLAFPKQTDPLGILKYNPFTREALQSTIDSLKAEYKEHKNDESMSEYNGAYDYVIKYLYDHYAEIVTLPKYDVLFF